MQPLTTLQARLAAHNLQEQASGFRYHAVYIQVCRNQLDPCEPASSVLPKLFASLGPLPRILVPVDGHGNGNTSTMGEFVEVDVTLPNLGSKLGLPGRFRHNVMAVLMLPLLWKFPTALLLSVRSSCSLLLPHPIRRAIYVLDSCSSQRVGWIRPIGCRGKLQSPVMPPMPMRLSPPCQLAATTCVVRNHPQQPSLRRRFGSNLSDGLIL
ncbi:hypothetical protein B0T21DRAFT_101587 [Apiosordaria backusii]|uniref:Uncharacterized protein n=1 Tax=Apiosordaria backusii TaxID=314023 RepID=A0AA40K494_9PEZI|nr:hypothetical protein B0T21DRAFT_101587 [Apiosordaria backusii]